MKRTGEIAHRIRNKEGKLCDKPEEIKNVHMDWYKELLTTSKGETKAELETEVIVNQLWNSIKIIAERQPPIRTTVEEVEEIIKNLDEF